LLELDNLHMKTWYNSSWTHMLYSNWCCI
jgi:hypothetical protein